MLPQQAENTVRPKFFASVSFFERHPARAKPKQEASPKRAPAWRKIFYTDISRKSPSQAAMAVQKTSQVFRFLSLCN